MFTQPGMCLQAFARLLFKRRSGGDARNVPATICASQGHLKVFNLIPNERVKVSPLLFLPMLLFLNVLSKDHKGFECGTRPAEGNTNCFTSVLSYSSNDCHLPLYIFLLLSSYFLLHRFSLRMYFLI